MLDNCYIKNNISRNIYTISVQESAHDLNIELNLNENHELEFNVLYLEFSYPIIAFRNSQYQWQQNNKRESIANTHSPKIIVLSNGKHLVSSKNIGIWSISRSNPKRLKWILDHPLATPIFFYDSKGKRIFDNKFKAKNYSLKILCTSKKVPEFSRSKIPFSSIICFTDHCDFDTQDNLINQLSFFRKHQIKITKGFFLTQYSKRDGNASFEFNSNILSKFYINNNELAYHSLTQSIKPEKIGVSEFMLFNQPNNLTINTYIDHGYQPYNFTQIKEHFKTDSTWAARMKQIGIKNLWNYVDGGTANNCMINQINPEHFTVKMMVKKNLTDYSFILRSLFHFKANETLRDKFKIFVTKLKKLRKKINIKHLLEFILHFCQFVFETVKILFKMKWTVPFHLVKYSPLIFKYEVGGHSFNMFQTIEMTNFENSLSKKNIDQLVEESGACIVHCYFSSPLPHQKGRFTNKNNIPQKIHENFGYLGAQIDQKKIWNPTVDELIEFQNKIFNLEFYYDKDADLIKSNDPSIPLRFISYV